MVVYPWSTAEFLHYLVGILGLLFGLKNVVSSLFSLKPSFRSLFSALSCAFTDVLDFGELVLMLVSSIVSCFTALLILSTTFSKTLPHFSSPL